MKNKSDKKRDAHFKRITAKKKKEKFDEIAVWNNAAITPSTINPNMFFKNFMHV